MAKKADAWGEAVGMVKWAKYMKPAPGDLRIVQAFLNTWDAETQLEELSDPWALENWMTRWGLLSQTPGPSTALGDPEVHSALEVRRALRALVRAAAGAAMTSANAAVLDRAAHGAHLRLRFDAGGGVRVEPAASGFDAGLGRLLFIVRDSVVNGTWSRLKLCSSSTCSRIFYDFSPNRSGVWCTMRLCGNRVKVQAYRKSPRGRRS